MVNTNMPNKNILYAHHHQSVVLLWCAKPGLSINGGNPPKWPFAKSTNHRGLYGYTMYMGHTHVQHIIQPLFFRYTCSHGSVSVDPGFTHFIPTGGLKQCFRMVKKGEPLPVNGSGWWMLTIILLSMINTISYSWPLFTFNKKQHIHTYSHDQLSLNPHHSPLTIHLAVGYYSSYIVVGYYMLLLPSINH